MLNTIHKRVLSLSTWPNLAILLVAFLACLQGFTWRQQQLEPSPALPDGRLGGYTPGELRELFEVWGEGRRQLYAVSELTLDGVFPLVYGTLFAVCLARLFTAERSRWLVLIPLLTAVFDLSENLLLATLAWQYDGRVSAFASIASALTVVKQLGFLASLVLLLIGGLASRLQSADRQTDSP